jgi:hypothetical protein
MSKDIYPMLQQAKKDSLILIFLIANKLKRILKESFLIAQGKIDKNFLNL